MSRVYLTMALDGFITGPNDDADNPAGIVGMRLMDWLGSGDTAAQDQGDAGGGAGGWRPSDPASRLVFDESMATGAVIAGMLTARDADDLPRAHRHHNDVV